MKKRINEIFEQLQIEGHNISLIDYSKESDGEVWVAYVINQDAFQIREIKKYLDETGNLLEPTEDLIESLDELYSTLRNVCLKVN